MKKKTYQHLNPIWENEADSVIAIKLSTNSTDYNYTWESLWSKQVSKNRFVICCIPFFAHNLSLGDEVLTNEDLLIQKVMLPSGQMTFRIWFGESADTNSHFMLVEELTKMGCLLEWYSQNLLAISCAEKDAQRVADFLMDNENMGLIIYETGKM